MLFFAEVATFFFDAFAGSLVSMLFASLIASLPCRTSRLLQCRACCAAMIFSSFMLVCRRQFYTRYFDAVAAC